MRRRAQKSGRDVKYSDNMKRDSFRRDAPAQEALNHVRRAPAADIRTTKVPRIGNLVGHVFQSLELFMASKLVCHIAVMRR